MTNMSYCRFTNTLSDLEDCEQALSDGEELSDWEAEAARKLIDLCSTIADFDKDDLNVEK